MMHCPFCKSPAHAKSSRCMSEQVKERYHQCTNLDCSCSFKTYENIVKVITCPPQPEPAPTPPPHPASGWGKKTLGRHGSAFRH